MLDLLDVRKLRVLREVAARGTIAAAAQALRMTPSAASQQLSALERSTGVELVVRTGRSVRLTPSAQRLVEHTEKVLAQLEAARVDLSSDPDQTAGELHLAAFASAIRELVVPSLAPLRAEHPALDVGIIQRDAEEAIAALVTGTVDVALVYDYDLLPSPAPAGAELEQLLQEPVLLVLPRQLADELAGPDGVALELARLAGERWIAPLDGSSCNTFVQRACNIAGFEPEFWALSDDFAAIADLVEAEHGVAMIPALGCGSLPAGVRALAVREPVVHRRVHLATRTGNRDHPAVQAVAGQLRLAARAVARRTGSGGAPAAARLTPAR